MSDEPFTEDQNWVMESGIPIRMYSGGKLQGASTSVPPFTDADDGDVLTIVDGEPQWEPPAGGDAITTVWKMQSPYWLVRYGASFAIQNLPFAFSAQDAFIVPSPTHAPGLLGLPVDNLTSDDFTLASGSGTAISAALPLTTDGQTLATPRAGYDVSCLTASSGTVSWPTAYSVTVTLGATRSYTARVINGSSPATDANTYWIMPFSGAVLSRTEAIPTGINTTSSNPSTPHFVATLSSSTTWTVTIARMSFTL